jgi:glycosyltransferase involved in cell wall biosynthesis
MLKIAYVSTWPPRECGIATFCQDLAKSIEKADPKISWQVIAINETGKKYRYDNKVKFQIDQEDFKTYQKAAEYINRSDINILSIQHEYGIFGGEVGEMIIDFINLVKKPIVTTIHSVPYPKLWKGINPKKKIKILKELGKQSEKLVAICHTGKDILTKEYQIPASKIEVIYHGGPEIKKVDLKTAKKKIGFSEDTNIIMSYGLLRPDKNYEQVINALPRILSRFPNTIFLICGEDHPTLGHDYYHLLQELIKKLNLEKKVIFIHKYLTLSEIIDYLRASDILTHTTYILNMASSGVLTYGMIAGKCIIATPFFYAKEVLAQNRGILIPVNDSEILAKRVIELLENPLAKQKMEKKISKFGQKFAWPRIGKRYLNLFQRVLHEKT